MYVHLISDTSLHAHIHTYVYTNMYVHPMPIPREYYKLEMQIECFLQNIMYSNR